MNTQGREN